MSKWAKKIPNTILTHKELPKAFKIFPMWQIWSHCHTTCDHGKKSALAKPDRGLKARLNAIVQYETQGITQCVNESSQAK